MDAVLANTKPWHVECIDVLAGLRSLPDRSVQCVVTSPPYFALRDYGVDGQIGLEKSPQEFIAKLVEVFGEVRRVLRDDGTVWCNMGDSYCAAQGGRQSEAGLLPIDTKYSVSEPWNGQRGDTTTVIPPRGTNVKPKDLMGMPWRLAFSLQDAGWWLRSEIIWHKRSPMPESVRDRPTKAHEQIFLLTKSPRYFYDQEASKEKATGGTNDRGTKLSPPKEAANTAAGNGHAEWTAYTADAVENRNMRTVWTLSTEPNSDAHFATFPSELVRKCLLAGISAKGCCPICGSPWRRIVSKDRKATRPGNNGKLSVPTGWDTSTGEGGHGQYHKDGRRKSVTTKVHHDPAIVGNRDPQRHTTTTETTGWEPGCACGGEPVGCVVLDPFTGSGTTGIVARMMGCRFLGFELNPDYATMARGKIGDACPLFTTT